MDCREYFSMGYSIAEYEQSVKQSNFEETEQNMDQVLFDNKEDDHDIHSHDNQVQETFSPFFTHNDGNVPDASATLHYLQNHTTGLQVCTDDTDLPENYSSTSKSETSNDFVDEKALKLKCLPEETTEKKVKDPANESIDDDNGFPLELSRYLKNPSRTVYTEAQNPVVCMLRVQLPTPVSENEEKRDQNSQDYSAEMHRLGTYGEYPPHVPIYAIKLAQNGFIYKNDTKAVQCYFCNLNIPVADLSLPGASPGKLHQERSPSCPFIQGLSCGNVPFPKFNEATQTAETDPSSTEEIERGRRDNSRRSEEMNRMREETGRVREIEEPKRRPVYQADSVMMPPFLTVEMPPQQSQQSNNNQVGRTVSDSVPSIQQPQPSGSRQRPGASGNSSESPRQNLPMSSQSATVAAPSQGNRARTSAASRSSANSSRSPPQSQSGNVNSATATTQSQSGTGGKNSGASGNAAATTQSGTSEKNNSTSGNGGNKTEKEKEKKKLTYSDLGIFADKPKREDMAVMAKRLSTFTGKWKTSYSQTPQMLADAGMYYAGYADCARCFFCGGGLKNWEAPDNPWIEHARWFPKCAYIRMCKGPKFVEIVQRKNKNREEMTLQEVEAEANADSPKHDSAIDKTKVPTPVSVGPDLKNMTATVAGSDYNPKTEDLETLEAENEELKTQMACKICMDEDSSVVFLPCGHLVACTHCAIALKICPLCRTDIKGSVRAHMIN